MKLFKMWHSKLKPFILEPKEYALRIIILIWIILWVVFHFMSSAEDLSNYKQLKDLSLEQKHAYILGMELYDFLLFCKAKLPPCQKVSLRANFKGYFDFKFRYYLYPHHICADADYVVVYNDKLFYKEGYSTFAQFDESSRILKRSKESN